MSAQEKIPKILSVANQYQKNGLRRGQSLMNALWEVCPEIYAQIKGTGADCFYNDALLANFWSAVSEKIGE